MTATILKFPKERVEYSPDDYRPEPAEIHIAFIGHREEASPREVAEAWIAFWWMGGMI